METIKKGKEPEKSKKIKCYYCKCELYAYFREPVKEDLWPSEYLDYFEKLKTDHRLWKNNEIHDGAMSATIHNFILHAEKLKQNYNITPKEK